MEVRNLVTFLKVTELKSFSRAAEALDYSQSLPYCVMETVLPMQSKSGKMKLDYTGYVSFQTLDKPYDVVSDYASYMEYLNEGMTNSNKPAPFSQNVINLWKDTNPYNPTSFYRIYRI